MKRLLAVIGGWLLLSPAIAVTEFSVMR